MLCLANHRAGYLSNLTCDWLSIVWGYSKLETENEPSSQWRVCRSIAICLIESDKILVVRRDRPIPLLLMPYLLKSPSHQQPLNWLFSIDLSLFFMKEDFVISEKFTILQANVYSVIRTLYLAMTCRLMLCLLRSPTQQRQGRDCVIETDLCLG